MTDTISVLVIASATSTHSDIIDGIDHEPHLQMVGTAASLSQALVAVRDTQPDVILIDEQLDDTNTLSLTEELVTRYPDLTVIAVVREGHMDYVRQAMLAGARGFVTTPMANGELSQALRRFYRLDLTRQTSSTSVSSEPQPAKEGTVVCIYSPKGGVGKTTLAANLAVALAKETGGRIAVLDTTPQFGHLGLVLNVHANYSLMDLLTRSDDLEPELVEGMMATHSSGVRVLLAPTEIERVDSIPPQGLSKLLARLRTMFDWTVVDTWPLLTESTLDVLEAADRVLVVVVPDITCLRGTKQFLDLADSLNYSLNKFDIIINRATDGGLDRGVVEEGLNRKILMEMPQDDPLVTHSLNRGIPVVISHARSPVSKAVRELAASMATDGQQRQRRRKLGARFKGLFGTA